MNLTNYNSSYAPDYFTDSFLVEPRLNFIQLFKNIKSIVPSSFIQPKPWELDVKNNKITEAGSWFEQTKEAEILRAIRAIQRSNIKIPYSSDVMDYLILYPDILDLLLDACASTKEEFQEQSQLSLEVFKDPESDDKYLTLYVRQEKYATNILERIENISEKFYEPLGKKRGWFIINTDFSFPRK